MQMEANKESIEPRCKETNEEIIKKWNEGGIVWSVEMGGIGPSYEQCIQLLIFEILTKWGTKPAPELPTQEYPKEYSDFVSEIAHEMDKELGFSGAQVGAAKGVAFNFIKYGYAHMMNKAPSDRLIQVSKNFPGYKRVNA